MLTVDTAKCAFVDAIHDWTNNYSWGVGCRDEVYDLYVAIKLSELDDAYTCDDVTVSQTSINRVFEDYM